MVPKFANPHSLSQDMENTTRSEIAERTGVVSVVHDEASHSLKHDMDSMLRDTWAGVLTETSSPSRAKKHRKTAEGCERGDSQLVFRLVSSMKHPQRISLDPKPPPPPVYVARLGEPDCEDDETQANVRRIRALSVAVESESLVRAAVSPIGQVNPKPVAVEAKIPLSSTPRPLPPFLVTEEVRATKRGKARHPHAVPSPHEPRLSCTVLPVISGLDKKELRGKKRQKPVKERPPPAYWRPPPNIRGKCLGYALGYP